jgi:hypothetical protein
MLLTFAANVSKFAAIEYFRKLVINTMVNKYAIVMTVGGASLILAGKAREFLKYKSNVTTEEVINFMLLEIDNFISHWAPFVGAASVFLGIVSMMPARK